MSCWVVAPRYSDLFLRPWRLIIPFLWNFDILLQTSMISHVRTPQSLRLPPWESQIWNTCQHRSWSAVKFICDSVYLKASWYCKWRVRSPEIGCLINGFKKKSIRGQEFAAFIPQNTRIFLICVISDFPSKNSDRMYGKKPKGYLNPWWHQIVAFQSIFRHRPSSI